MNTQRFTPAHQAGISMVEMMVAVTLGLFILAGIGLTLTSTSHSRTELDRALQQIENGRYAMQMLAHDLRHAGYYGRYAGELTLPAAMPDPCAATLAALEAGMPLPVQGFDAPMTVPPELAPCLASANHVPGTDILVVRRAQAGQPVELAAASPGQVYLQTTAYPGGPRYVLGTGSNPAAFNLIEKRDDHSGATVPAGLLPYRVHVYFVSPCDIPTSGDTCNGDDDDGGRPISTLKRLELAAASPGQVYLQTTAYPGGPRYVLGTGSNPAAFNLIEKRDDHSGATVPAGLLPYRVHVYFVSPCDIPTTGDTCNGTDDGGRPISTLKRLELATDVGGNPVMRTVPLVEGIQNLQIDYGIDQPAPGASVG
ncbi:MAG TPA: hypothetical protein VFU53_12925, partial [Burkholderiales bacterium]|nr:hypothetical protein [Burkholderiales bacterium]